MTLIQLEYIVAVDTHRHFGRAAEASFVTQPTLSMQIQKLEEQLGVQIFDRAKQPIAPTILGERLIAQARIILNETGKIKELINEERGVIQGDVTLGIIPTLSPYLLPLFITPFLEKYSNVFVQAEELVTSALLKKLHRGEIDVALLSTPIDEPGTRTIPLFYEEFIAYVNPNSKLFNHSSLQTADLYDENMWLLNEGHCFREQALNICQNYREQTHHFKFESGSLTALKKMVDLHGGLTLLPELAIADFSEEAKTRLRRFESPAPLREISLVIRENFPKQRLIESMKNEIKTALPSTVRQSDDGVVIKWN